MTGGYYSKKLRISFVVGREMEGGGGEGMGRGGGGGECIKFIVFIFWGFPAPLHQTGGVVQNILPYNARNTRIGARLKITNYDSDLFLSLDVTVLFVDYILGVLALGIYLKQLLVENLIRPYEG